MTRTLPEGWGLIADDLTGACDTGVQFAQRGFSVVVWLDPEFICGGTADISVLTTNSRNDSPEVARAKVEKACGLLARQRATVIYKKIDSTLHGNPGPEIEAVMDASGFSLALVTPAFPAMGRTVVEGWLHVAGSGANVHVPSLFREQGMKRVLHYRQPEAERLAALRRSVVVLDSTIQEDLVLIARVAAGMNPSPLLAGSAGLAMEVAAVLAADRGKQPGAGTQAPSEGLDRGPVVLLLGSANPVTLRQIECLAARGAAVTGLCGGEDARRALSQGRHLIVRLEMTKAEEQHLAGLFAILEEFAVGAIVLSGGDTALLACHVLEVKGIRLEREIVSGIPWGRLVGGRWNGVAVATKAGGFGEEDALSRVADFLSAQGQTRK